jgi:hypothetical protein
MCTVSGVTESWEKIGGEITDRRVSVGKTAQLCHKTAYRLTSFLSLLFRLKFGLVKSLR